MRLEPAMSRLCSGMAEKEWEPANVFDIFGDDIARRVLVVASHGPASADDLDREMDVSRPTIYRRVNALVDYGLVTEDRRIDGDGNDYKTFETTFDHARFELTDTGYAVTVRMDRSLVDQFQQFWTDLDQPPAELTFTVDEEPAGPSDAHHG
jgi:DNA-binding transcriptional ArsR family regulator